MTKAVVALGLLVVDGFVAWVLIGRRAAARDPVAPRRSPGPEERWGRHERPGDDLLGHQTVVRASRSDGRAPAAAAERPWGAGRRPAPSRLDMTRDADLLAAPDPLVYEPATWER